MNIPQKSYLKMGQTVAGTSFKSNKRRSFINILLKIILPYIPIFIKDDVNILNHLPSKTNKESFLVSFDILNLYITINHKYRIIGLQYLQ